MHHYECLRTVHNIKFEEGKAWSNFSFFYVASSTMLFILKPWFCRLSSSHSVVSDPVILRSIPHSHAVITHRSLHTCHFFYFWFFEKVTFQDETHGKPSSAQWLAELINCILLVNLYERNNRSANHCAKDSTCSALFLVAWWECKVVAIYAVLLQCKNLPRNHWVRERVTFLISHRINGVKTRR